MSESTQQVQADKLVVPSIQPVGEWHRTEENVAILQKLVQAVYAPESILIAHHLCFVKDGRGYEIASVETFLFDPETLRTLFNDRWQQVAQALALTAPTLRLAMVQQFCSKFGVQI